ncbi:MAG: B12-binding domain-containing radical SAM protein, partial [Aquihabitans sp.]
MALLIFLDTGGPVFHLGDQAVVSDLAGLVAVEAILGGATPDLDDVAARCGGDRAALATLVRLLADVGPIDPLAPLAETAPVAAAAHPLATYEPSLLLQAQLPQPVLADADGYRVWPVGGLDPVQLDAYEVGLLGAFARPNRGEALVTGEPSGNPLLATDASRDRALADLCAQGLLTEQVSVPYRTTWDQGTASTMRIHHRTRTLVRQQAELLEQRPPRGDRVPVFGVERGTSTGPPLALGLLFAAAEAHRGGALLEHYDFVPDWHVRPASVRRAVSAGPAVFLFSNYVWSSSGNLAISAKVKELSAHSLVVHGGPNTPKFPGDREQYFADHPSVDVIVHGEGEVTLAEVLDALGGRLDGDLRALGDVPGITFRPLPGAEPVTTAERDRIADLDQIPSPFLLGIFDAWKHAATMVTMESNRGCPYGCTFCDWGSATASRIRKFDLDRVYAELDWIAAAEVPIVMIADANFGIFERDVAIVERIADLKARTGFPDRLLTNYAKN